MAEGKSEGTERMLISYLSVARAYSLCPPPTTLRGQNLLISLIKERIRITSTFTHLLFLSSHKPRHFYTFSNSISQFFDILSQCYQTWNKSFKDVNLNGLQRSETLMVFSMWDKRKTQSPMTETVYKMGPWSSAVEQRQAEKVLLISIDKSILISELAAIAGLLKGRRMIICCIARNWIRNRTVEVKISLFFSMKW